MPGTLDGKSDIGATRIHPYMASSLSGVAPGVVPISAFAAIFVRVTRICEERCEAQQHQEAKHAERTEFHVGCPFKNTACAAIARTSFFSGKMEKN